ncbi:hypothetical protein [Desulfococcus sp.]|uniref:hypothetical protein n=1 Tax=Desulfococcus sp. TaxID=2025834 RepID=UPI0035944600
MGDLVLSGLLNLKGMLTLAGRDGGKVKVDTFEVLVVAQKGAGPSHGQGVPVILPPPPASPIDTGVDVWIFESLNATVTASGKNIVTQGMCAQGNPGTATWPGMVQASIMNPTVTINSIPVNVTGDMGLIIATGAPVTFSSSGQ